MGVLGWIIVGVLAVMVGTVTTIWAAGGLGEKPFAALFASILVGIYVACVVLAVGAFIDELLS